MWQLLTHPRTFNLTIEGRSSAQALTGPLSNCPHVVPESSGWCGATLGVGQKGQVCANLPTAPHRLFSHPNSGCSLIDCRHLYNPNQMSLPERSLQNTTSPNSQPQCWSLGLPDLTDFPEVTLFHSVLGPWNLPCTLGILLHSNQWRKKAARVP